MTSTGKGLALATGTGPGRVLGTRISRAVRIKAMIGAVRRLTQNDPPIDQTPTDAQKITALESTIAMTMPELRYR